MTARNGDTPGRRTGGGATQINQQEIQPNITPANEAHPNDVAAASCPMSCSMDRRSCPWRCPPAGNSATETRRNAHSCLEYRCCATCTTQLGNPLPVGTIVTIGRDPDHWPPKGTWGRFAGRRGTIVVVSVEHLDLGANFAPEQRRPAFHVEYGVAFAKNPTGSVDHWFLPHEILVSP